MPADLTGGDSACAFIEQIISSRQPLPTALLETPIL